MRQLIIVVILVVALLLAGCGSVVVGSGNVISESRPVSGINAVDFDSSGELSIVQGAVESLTIEADSVFPHRHASRRARGEWLRQHPRHGSRS